ncbi:hypothetical protein XB05_14635 [Xanthomonas arboricola]|nr:hypothetical protein XB05_14635 [Xanthomonas arboricola]
MSAQAICSATASLLDAEVRTAALLPGTRSAIRLLAQYLENFANTLVHESDLPAWFLHNSPIHHNKSWWEQSPSIGKTLFKLGMDFRDTLSKDPPEAFNGIPGWLDARRKIVLKLQLASPSSGTGDFGVNESEVFRIASTLHAYSAEIHYSRGNYLLALLFLHRASEWLIASLCASNSLLIFTKSGYRLKTAAPGEVVGFDKMIDALVSNDPGALAGSGALFSELNAWRNLFAHTHHMSAPTAQVATGIYEQIRTLLKSIGGQPWRDSLKVLQQPFPLRVQDILDPNLVLRTGFRVESAAQLGIEAAAAL